MIMLSPSVLLLLVAASATCCSCLRVESAASQPELADELLKRSEASASSAPADGALLSRQRRNPLLIPVGVAVARVGARYVVRIGATFVRNFKARKDVVDFLRQPSTLRRIRNLPKDGGNIVSVPSKTMAKKLAKNVSGGKRARPEYHGQPGKGDPHFHPVDKLGKKMPAHISHPKISPKSRTKYSSGAKAKADRAQSGGNSNRGSRGGSSGGSRGGSSGGSRGGSSGGSRGGSSGGSRGNNRGGSRGGSSGGSRGNNRGGSRGGSSGGSRGGSSGGSRGNNRGGSMGGSRVGSRGGRRG